MGRLSGPEASIWRCLLSPLRTLKLWGEGILKSECYRPRWSPQLPPILLQNPISLRSGVWACDPVWLVGRKLTIHPSLIRGEEELPPSLQLSHKRCAKVECLGCEHLGSAFCKGRLSSRHLSPPRKARRCAQKNLFHH